METLKLNAGIETVNENNLSKIANLCFPVEKIKQSDLNASLVYNSEYTHAVIGNINGQKHYLNACSNRYELVSNNSFLPELYDIISTKFGGNNIEVKTKNHNNANFAIDFIINSEKHYFGGNPKDTLNFKITASNSYNGKANYNFEFGNQVYRQICSNGLHAWKLESLFSVKGKHTENVRLQLKNFANTLEQSLQNDIFGKLAQSFEPMAQIEVLNITDRLIEVMNIAQIATTSSNMAFLDEVITYEANKLNNGVVNNFLLYNGLNNLLFNTDSKATTQALEKKDKVVFDLLYV